MIEKKHTMIFHFPLKIDPEAKSASGIRPLKMLNAFKEAGCHVIEITGYSNERAMKIRQLKNKIAKGLKIDFVYSESSTMPTLLTDPSHIPLHPFIDFSFFKFCKKINIPIGLFYRDIYWKFPIYKKQVGKLKRIIAKIFYHYDLMNYRKFITILYLPSLKMGACFDFFKSIKYDDLPPGSDIGISCHEKYTSRNKKINLIYVGGTGDHYKQQKLIDAMKGKDFINLVICTRKEEWEVYKNNYKLDESNNIVIEFLFGDGLKKIYYESDIAILFIEPTEYGIFAVPYKLFEYIAYHKPIIASEGTYAGEYVKKYNIGWTIPYDESALSELLIKIYNNQEELELKKRNIQDHAIVTRWIDRAYKVIYNLVTDK
jgi:glycosyltransferase involved in cell wall biosynthesis